MEKIQKTCASAGLVIAIYSLAAISMGDLGDCAAFDGFRVWARNDEKRVRVPACQKN